MEEKNPATSSDINKNAPPEEVQSASQPQSAPLSSENDSHVNAADMENISVNRISIPEILVIVGIIIVVLLIGAASYILFTHSELIEKFEAELARKDSPEVVEEVIEEVVVEEVAAAPKVDWQIYEDQDFGYSIQYPMNYSITEEQLDDINAEAVLVLSTSDDSEKLIILANPSDFNEIIAEKTASASYSVDEGILIKTEEEQNIVDSQIIEGKTRKYISLDEVLPDYNLSFLYTYNEDNETSEGTLNEILSTFRLVSDTTDVDEVVEGDMVSFTSEGLGLSLKHPVDVKTIDGESYVLFYMTDAEESAINNDIYNGVNLRFSTGNLQGSTVQEYVTTELDGINGGTGETTQVTSVNYAGVEGYSYSSDYGIQKKYIYLPASNGKYMLIVDSTGDLDNIGYRAIADQMLNSVIIN